MRMSEAQTCSGWPLSASSKAMRCELPNHDFFLRTTHSAPINHKNETTMSLERMRPKFPFCLLGIHGWEGNRSRDCFTVYML